MKRQYVKTGLFVAAIFFGTLQTKAQQDQPAMPSSEENSPMPEPDISMPGNSETPAEISNLMKFVGDWESDATLTTEGKTVKVNYWVKCKTTADGKGIFADEGFSNPELGTMKGANLAGFDPIDAKVKWFSVDNMGTAHEHIGDWISPEHLVLLHDGTREGKQYVEKLDFIFTSENEMTFKLVGTLDGKQIALGEGVFHKKIK